MSLFRTYTPAKHRNGAKVAALAAAALLVASSAGSAEIGQKVRDLDSAVLVALGTQPKSAGGSSGEWVEVKGENEYQNEKTTRLILAADKGDTTAVERLLASGANVNAQEMRKEYVDHGNGSAGVEYIPETGRSALMAAAEKGHLAVVEKLLAAGANVNAHARYPKDGYMHDKGAGETALVFALKNGHNAVAERLLAAGADVNDGGHGGCVPETDDCGGSPYPLGLATRRGDTKMVNVLLQHKADPNLGLCDAASAGRTEMVKLLLDNGAKVNFDVSKVDPWNTSALTCAVWNRDKCQTETVRLLLDRGANPNIKFGGEWDPDIGDDAGKSVLQFARERGCTQIVRLLQSAGAGKKGAKKRK